jgi:hypothetical protein
MVTAIENRIPPPIVMVVTALAMWAFSWVTPTIPIPAGIRYGLVGVLLVLGVSVDGLAFFSFRRAGTTINPVAIDNASSLVTTGIYVFTRNGYESPQRPAEKSPPMLLPRLRASPLKAHRYRCGADAWRATSGRVHACNEARAGRDCRRFGTACATASWSHSGAAKAASMT